MFDCNWNSITSKPRSNDGVNFRILNEKTFFFELVDVYHASENERSEYSGCVGGLIGGSSRYWNHALPWITNRKFHRAFSLVAQARLTTNFRPGAALENSLPGSGPKSVHVSRPRTSSRSFNMVACRSTSKPIYGRKTNVYPILEFQIGTKWIEFDKMTLDNVAILRWSKSLLISDPATDFINHIKSN